MSKLKVEVVRIDDVQPHPNADRLELARVAGWFCVVQKGRYKAGDTAVYIPIDAILPEALEAKLFPPESKVKLHNRRIRTIKLRGAISQGLIVDCEEVGVYPRPGMDVAAELGITKYEPPTKGSPTASAGYKPKATKNPLFREYTEIENWKHYPQVFEPGEQVWVTEKIHGTNFRAGWVPYVPTSFWQKLVHGARKLVGLERKWEFVYGSHHVQLQRKSFGGYCGTNVYLEAVEKYDLEKKLPKGIVVYGEIYGDGIQKNYTYGCAPGERKLVVFDLMVYGSSRTGMYEDARHLAWDLELLKLPGLKPLYIGPYDEAKIRELTKGNSDLCPEQKIREGVVVKPRKEAAHPMIGRKVLKCISDDYLMREDTTEFH